MAISELPSSTVLQQSAQTRGWGVWGNPYWAQGTEAA